MRVELVSVALLISPGLEEDLCKRSARNVLPAFFQIELINDSPYFPVEGQVR